MNGLFVSTPAIPDVISVVGSGYFQPIADLMASLLKSEPPSPDLEQPNFLENGYSVSISILLVALLESYVGRLRFCRNDEIKSNLSVPNLLVLLFPDLPNKNELVEVFLYRNALIHNHIWHLDVSNPKQVSQTMASPKDLKFDINQHYTDVVDQGSRRTCLLGLNVNPRAANRCDVKIVFDIVWKTLLFMSSKDSSDTPLGGRIVSFRGQRMSFETLADFIVA